MKELSAIWAGCLLVMVLRLDMMVVTAAPEYQFSFGRITGVDEQAQDTLKPYTAFYGIPFADPPINGLRFRAPQPFSNRNPNRVISSTRFRAGCIQANIPPQATSEDCLHLNIFTPSNVNQGGQLKKVMVWIHGGGFVFGRALEYIPTRLVSDYDVIVVTLQYRLGMFGFLNPGGGKETNFGLRDQIMGIKWVKDNIQQFGGDGDDITIFGESAGAASVSLLALSPLSKGLFTRAIMQSGVANTNFATDANSEDKFQRFANKAGCTSWLQHIPFIRDQFKDDILNCMRSKSAAELLDATNNAPGPTAEGRNSDIGDDIYALMTGDQAIAPSIDGVVIPKNPNVLIEDKDYLQANGVLDRAYLVGFNNAEGLLSLIIFATSPGGGASLTYDTFTEPKAALGYVKGVAKTMYSQPVTDDVMDFVEYEYTYPRGDQGKPDVMNVLSVFNDVTFMVPTVQLARALTTLSPSTPVYLYLFDHYPDLVDPSSPVKGSTHGLEIMYQFDRTPSAAAFYDFYAKIDTPSDQPLFNIVRNTWTQFAKTGRPASQEYASWPRFTPKDEFYMALSTSPEVRQRVYAKRVDLWTKVLPKRASQSFRSRSFKLY